MSIDIKRAFNKPFCDELWLQKMLTGGFFFYLILVFLILIGIVNSIIGAFSFNYGYELSLIGKVMNIILVFISVFLGVFISAIPIGYALKVAHNEIKAEDSYLPGWNSKINDYFNYGMNFYLINFLYLLMMGAIAAIPVTISAFIFNFYQDNPVISLISLIFIILFVTPFLLFYFVILPFIITSYADNFDFQSAFKLDGILVSISKVIPDYLVSIVLSIIIFSLLPLLISLLTFSCIGIFLLPFLILPIYIIILTLFSEAYRQSQAGL